VRVNGNNATVVGVETIKGRWPNGEQVEFDAVTTNVYEKQADRWLMVHHQASRPQ
jgi:ketosteroid isomerase-like protein